MEEKDNQFALKYRPEYAHQVYEHMKNGYSISSFNVTPTVAQKTIFAWVKDHVEFSLAIDRGKAEFLRKLETASNVKTFGIVDPKLKEAGIGKIDGEQLRFTLRTRYRNEYSEKQIVEHQGDAITKINFIEVGSRPEPKDDA